MSTRFVKKDNVVLVGVAKNGSQAIKQISLQNDGFEVREQQGDWNKDNFIDWNDSNLLILFPIRNQDEKVISEMLEVAMKKDIGETFESKLDYFSNDVMKYFIENILFDENWSGVKIRFFDLKKLTSHIPKYLGWDIQIPYYNTSDGNRKKQILREQLKDVVIKTPSINKIFFESLKKSKYWINL
mgnify:FL=1|tara:strand:+ start:123 stop:677 length:555 start_codon:yes stop_codon:yes gene_type:complete